MGYFSSDGFKCHNYPFTSQSYGPPLAEGDVLGVGYRPRTGAVFFTRNGKKLDDAYIGLTKHNLFPTVAADGAASIHVNFGQAGFVFIEANVKKWGLAPMIGTLAPPPAYGSERGSILLETATGPQATETPLSSSMPNAHQRQRSNEAAAVAALALPNPLEAGSTRARTPAHRRLPSGSTVPIRPSPLRTSMTRQQTSSYSGSSTSAATSPVSIPGTSPPHDRDVFDRAEEEEDSPLPHNPPTPGQLDIALRAMSPFSQRRELEDREEERRRNQSEGMSASSSSSSSSFPSSSSQHQGPPVLTSSTPPYHISVTTPAPAVRSAGDVSPPSYQLIDSNQYPAGVAEAMLETMPEEQFAALFADAATANGQGQGQGQGQGTSNGNGSRNSTGTSTTPSSFNPGNGGEGTERMEGSQGQQGLGLGLRGIFSNVWRRPSSDRAQSSQSVSDSSQV